MIKRFIGGTKRLLRLHRPGRDLEVFPDDVFLVSYPKSGNTWTRFLVANLVHPDQQVDFSTINRLTPDPEALSVRKLTQTPRPRIIKSHQYFDPRYRQVVYIVRDPRDVVLSEYHFSIKRGLIGENYPIEKFVASFLQLSIEHAYGTWAENVASWLYVRGSDPGFLLVKYEDLQADGMRELARIAEFLGIAPDPQRLSLALERSSADRMRELERKQAHLWSSTLQTRLDKPFVRTATSGGWKTELPHACVVEIESAWGKLMENLGYELAVHSLQQKTR